MRPSLVILDEAVSALDKSVEAQVLNLLADLRRDFDLTYMFISHDLNVVRFVSDQLMVMYLGEVVEIGPSETLRIHHRHPYTSALFAAMPSMDPDRRTETPPLAGRPAQSDRPALRMPVPHAMPVRRAGLRADGSAPAGGRDRHAAPRRVPHGRSGIGPQGRGPVNAPLVGDREPRRPLRRHAAGPCGERRRSAARSGRGSGAARRVAGPARASRSRRF